MRVVHEVPHAKFLSFSRVWTELVFSACTLSYFLVYQDLSAFFSSGVSHGYWNCLCFFFVGSRVEVGLLGTALPVLLSVSPSPVFKFGDCPVGEQIDALCTINNESASLPVTISLHSTAHFDSSPSQSHITPGQSVDVLLSFRPNQMGTFKPVVPLEVLGGIIEEFSFDGDPTAIRYNKTLSRFFFLFFSG